jgi:hypothetical protein
MAAADYPEAPGPQAMTGVSIPGVRGGAAGHLT